ncbi:MAG: hypothetical protein Q9216_003769 [Gyalolechia sp. 2 TL-2023]
MTAGTNHTNQNPALQVEESCLRFQFMRNVIARNLRVLMLRPNSPSGEVSESEAPSGTLKRKREIADFSKEDEDIEEGGNESQRSE